MKHQKYREMMELALLAELSEEQMEDLHKHLLECDDCQYEYDKLNDFYKSLDKIEKKEPDEILLQNARRELRLKIDKQISDRSFFEKITEGVKNLLFYYYKPVITVTSSLIVGLFLGYMFFHTNVENSYVETLLSNQNQAKITNVNFIRPGINNNGEVEFTFDALQPVKIKGKVSDPKIQMILAQALINEKNPGTRINTVSAIADQTINKNTTDPKIKEALISTLKYDSNPGVRRQALNALLNLNLDNQTEDALLYSLVHDSNSGIRIAAINGLTSISMEGRKFNEETLKILKQKSKQDDNEYVRIRAASLVKEAQLL